MTGAGREDGRRHAPRVSVVIPAYERGDLLERTLASVLAQTFADWECIVVDDGSEDDTADVARRWAARDPRFRCERQENAGAGAARNRGIELARGEYVSFIDSDDLMTADKLAWQVAALDADPEAVMVYGDARHFEHEDPDRTYEYLARVEEKPSGEDAFEELLSCSAIYAPTIRASALEVARFDEGLPSAEDWDMWLRVARLGPVLHEDRIALRYRLHEGGKSTNTLRNYRCARKVLERHLAHVPPERRARRRREALASFRVGYPPRLAREAEELTARGRWEEAQLRWRALAGLAPGRLASARRLAYVAWSLLPTATPPPWLGLRSRLRRWLGPHGRHRMAAGLRAAAKAPQWRLRAARLRRSVPAGTAPALVGIALVDHLGDLVAAEPVARDLRRAHPDARLVWIVRDDYAELPRAYPEIDETWTVGCLTEWIALREGHPFDRLVDLHVPGRSCGTCQVRLEREDADPDLHIGNYYEHGDLQRIFRQSAGLPGRSVPPRLAPPPEARRTVDGLGLPAEYVVLHARSAQPARDWRDEAWRELARRLPRETGCAVVEVGLEPVIAPAVEDCVNLCGRLSILETAEVVRRSRLFVGIDSGPAHLANAVGADAVLLLGRYRSYERYRPWDPAFVAPGGRGRIVRAEGPAAELDVDRVLGAVAERLGAPARGVPA